MHKDILSNIWDCCWRFWPPLTNDVGRLIARDVDSSDFTYIDLYFSNHFIAADVSDSKNDNDLMNINVKLEKFKRGISILILAYCKRGKYYVKHFHDISFIKLDPNSCWKFKFCVILQKRESLREKISWHFFHQVTF